MLVVLNIVFISIRGLLIVFWGVLNVIIMSIWMDVCLEWYNKNELILYSIYFIICIYVCKLFGFSMFVCV